MDIRAFGHNCQAAKLRSFRSERAWMGRVDRSLVRLKVSHSQLRIGVGMLRESVDALCKQTAQQRADIHELGQIVAPDTSSGQ